MQIETKRMTVMFHACKCQSSTKRIRHQDVLTVLDSEQPEELEEEADDDAGPSFTTLQEAMTTKCA